MISGAAVSLYLVIAGWALIKRRLVIGGCSMLAVSILPVLWQAMATESEAKGEGMLAALLFLPALVMIAIGGLAALTKGARRFLANGQST